MNDFSPFKLIAAIGLVMLSCALFSTLPACGHKASTAEGQQSAIQASGLLPAAGLARAQHLLREAQVVCADDRRCPESVGMVVTASDEGVLRCTGALIGSDLLLTSSRCVPESLRGDAGCGESVRFVLPALSAGNQPAQQARCGRVLEAVTGAPYAFVRLEAPVSGRHPLAVDVAGLPDGAGFKLPVVNPTSDTKPFGEIRVLDCKAYQNTALLPQFRSPFSPVATLGGCAVSPAGFGAPALDERGSARAVVQGDFAPDAIQQYQLVYGELLQNTPVADFAIAANLACVPVPGGDGRALPAACDLDAKFKISESALGRAIPADLLSAAQAQIAGLLSQWQASPGQQLHWSPAKLAVTPAQRVPLLPACFAGSEHWLPAYHHWYIRGGYDQDERISVQLPGYQVSFVMNAFLQTRFNVQNQPATSVTLHFSPKELASSGRSTVSVFSAATGAAVGSPVVLSKCPN